jgi:hypothetical protein
VLPNFLESKLQFLKSFGITFGGFIANIDGDYFTPLWFIFAFILVLFFKNSMEKRDSFKPNYKLAFLIAFCFIFGILSLNKVSEFLYFNF